MKLTLNLAALAMFSFLFFSCQNSPTGVEGGNYYQFDWTVENSSVDSALTVSAADESNSFIAGFYGHKCYRVADGVTTQLELNDTTFGTGDVKALDKNYAVFSGYRRYGSSAILIKIYDNGVIRPYSISPYKGDPTVGYTYIEAKDNFFIAHLHHPIVYNFVNGVITQYTLPDEVSITMIEKINGSIYVFGYSETTFKMYVFKFTGSGFVRLPADFGSIWMTYKLDKDVMRLIQFDNYWNFSYFTEQGWQEVCTYTPVSAREGVWYLTGSSHDFFTAISCNDSTKLFHATVWNSYAFDEQKNFPALRQPSGNFPIWKKSEYKNNTVVLYYSDNGGKFLRGKLKGY